MMNTWIGLETDTAWVVAIIAAALGTWMVATGMFEELLLILRRAMSSTANAPRPSSVKRAPASPQTRNERSS